MNTQGDTVTNAHSTPPDDGAPGGPLIDITVPHSARIWNYWLGGRDNYEVDRAAGDQFRNVFPAIVDIARASRQFLARTIRFLAGEAGIRQFLDVGSGLPTQDNTHELAQRITPWARIVYADNDPLVLAHSRALLSSTAEGITGYILADLRDPARLLAEAAHTLDLTWPVALILNGVLGHVTDLGEARSIVRDLMAGVSSGSYLSVMDGTSAITGHPAERAQQGYNDTGALPYVLRTPAEIAGFFEGLDLVEPGVVSCTQWRPDAAESSPPPEVDAFGGVARKP
jgi:S-adenosyl methyltransferase